MKSQENALKRCTTSGLLKIISKINIEVLLVGRPILQPTTVTNHRLFVKVERLNYSAIKSPGIRVSLGLTWSSLGKSPTDISISQRKI
jgi:hypothetical protein